MNRKRKGNKSLAQERNKRLERDLGHEEDGRQDV